MHAFLLATYLENIYIAIMKDAINLCLGKFVTGAHFSICWLQMGFDHFFILNIATLSNKGIY